MSLIIGFNHTTGVGTLVAEIRKITSAGVLGDYWNNATAAFTAGDPGSNGYITPTEVGAGYYRFVSNGDLETYTGKIEVTITDTNTNQTWGSVNEMESGVLVTGTSSSSATPITTVASGQATEGEYGVEQVIPIKIATSSGATSTAAVDTTEIATPAATPIFSSASNAASYTGTSGVYQVTLTATEAQSPKLIRVTTVDTEVGETFFIPRYQATAPQIVYGHNGNPEGDSQTITIVCSDSDGSLVSDSVSTTQIAVPAASPSYSAANGTAAYTGIPGVYSLVISSAECTQPQLFKVTTASGSGTALFIPTLGATRGQVAVTDAAVDATKLVADAILADTTDGGPIMTEIATKASQVSVDELPATISDFDDAIPELERNVSHVVLVTIRDANGDLVGAESIASTQIATPGTVPSYTSATNAATYTGVLGLYKVTLTAAECNVPERLLRVSTTTGTGEKILLFRDSSIETDLKTGGDISNAIFAIQDDTNELQGDWTDGGRLDVILDSANAAAATDLTPVLTAVSALHTDVTTIDGIVDTINVNTVAILADTGELQTDWVNGGRLDTLLDTAASGSDLSTVLANQATIEGKIDTIDGIVDTLDTRTTTIATHADTLHTWWDNDPAGSLYTQLLAASGGVDLSTLETKIDTIDTEVGTLTSNLSALDAKVVVVDGIVDTINTTTTTILADTDSLQTEWANGGRLDTLLDTAAASVDLTGVTADIAAVQATANSIESKVDTVDTVVDSLAVDLATVDGIVDTINTNTAATLADTNSLQTEWADGGRLDLILDSAASGSDLSGVTADIAAVQSTVDSIETKVDAVQTTAGGIVTTQGNHTTELSTIKADTDEVQTSLAAGGAIRTLIEGIDGSGSAISPDIVDGSRTWVANDYSSIARPTLQIAAGSGVTVSMDFTQVLNRGTSIQSASGAVLTSGSGLSIGTPVVAQGRQAVNLELSSIEADAEYTVKVSCLTTDGDTLAYYGKLKGI